MPTYRDRGIVLKTKVLRDADRHYTFLTEHHGKVTVLAKGSRRSKSKMSSHLASFGIVEIMVARGKMIDRLAGASLVRPHRGVLASLEKSAVAQHFFLMIDALVRQDWPDEKVFALAASFLETADALAADALNMTLVYQAAMTKLLDALGYGLELSACVRCRRALVPEGNAFNLSRGGMECGGCRSEVSAPVSGDAIKALRFLRGETCADAARLALPSAVRRELAVVIDLALSPHLDARAPSGAYLSAVL